MKMMARPLRALRSGDARAPSPSCPRPSTTPGRSPSSATSSWSSAACTCRSRSCPPGVDAHEYLERALLGGPAPPPARTQGRTATSACATSWRWSRRPASPTTCTSCARSRLRPRRRASRMGVRGSAAASLILYCARRHGHRPARSRTSSSSASSTSSARRRPTSTSTSPTTGVRKCCASSPSATATTAWPRSSPSARSAPRPRSATSAAPSA